LVRAFGRGKVVAFFLIAREIGSFGKFSIERFDEDVLGHGESQSHALPSPSVDLDNAGSTVALT